MKKVFSITLLLAVFSITALLGQTQPPPPQPPTNAGATAQTLSVADNPARTPQTLNLKIEVTAADTFKVDYLMKNPNAPDNPSVVGGYVVYVGDKKPIYLDSHKQPINKRGRRSIKTYYLLFKIQV